MKNIKKFLAFPLTALALYGFTACKPVEPYNVNFDSYKLERLAKESQVRMYRDGKLIAKKLYRDDELYKRVDGKPIYPVLEKYTPKDPVYEFYDENGKIFAEARLKYEIVSLKGEEKPVEIYGDFMVFDDGMYYSNPLWKELVDMQLRGEGKKFAGGKYYKKWYVASDLFVDFLNGEKLLEEKYKKDF